MGFFITLQVSSIRSARLKFLSDFCSACHMAVSKSHRPFVLPCRLPNFCGMPADAEAIVNQSRSVEAAQDALAGHHTCAMLFLSFSGTFTPA